MNAHAHRRWPAPAEDIGRQLEVPLKWSALRWRKLVARHPEAMNLWRCTVRQLDGSYRTFVQVLGIHDQKI